MYGGIVGRDGEDGLVVDHHGDGAAAAPASASASATATAFGWDGGVTPATPDAAPPASAADVPPVRLAWVEGDAERLERFPDGAFDSYTIAFGIRNVTDIPRALREAARVLRPGGRFLCLEFSHVQSSVLRELYAAYSFNVIPAIGEYVADDRDSYQYLVESIQRFPPQLEFAGMLREAGFAHVQHTNFLDGVVAVHSGFKLEE